MRSLAFIALVIGTVLLLASDGRPAADTALLVLCLGVLLEIAARVGHAAGRADVQDAAHPPVPPPVPASPRPPVPASPVFEPIKAFPVIAPKKGGENSRPTGPRPAPPAAPPRAVSIAKEIWENGVRTK